MRTLILIFLLFVGHASSAALSHERVSSRLGPQRLADGQQTVLRNRVMHPVHALVKAGIFHLGGVDLRRLIAEVESVTYWQANYSIAGQGRIGHHYDVLTKQVTFTSYVVNGDTPVKNLVGLLHETIGALGYVDDIYQISSIILAAEGALENKPALLLYLKSISESLQVGQARRTENPKTTFGEMGSSEQRNLKLYQKWASGGASEGGGGGDPEGATVKTYLIYQMLIKNLELNLINYSLTRFDIESFGSLSRVMEDFNGSCPSPVSPLAGTILRKVENVTVMHISQLCLGSSVQPLLIDQIETFVRDLYENKKLF